MTELNLLRRASSSDLAGASGFPMIGDSWTTRPCLIAFVAIMPSSVAG
jgi:hypothetical protein